MKSPSGKLIYTIILAAIFFVYFGKPSFENYQEKETLISEKRVRFNTSKSPAITIIVKNQNKRVVSMDGKIKIKKWKEIIFSKLLKTFVTNPPVSTKLCGVSTMKHTICLK